MLNEVYFFVLVNDFGKGHFESCDDSYLGLRRGPTVYLRKDEDCFSLQEFHLEK